MIVVLGGTGTTGSLITSTLRSRGYAVRPASRRTTIPFDWTDPGTHDATLAGAGALYLITPLGVVDPAPIMLPFLERAARAGVTRAVLLSSSIIEPGDSALGLVHARLPSLVEEWAVLRPSWFMENFVGDHPHAISARTTGEIVSATGDGRVPFIDPGDIAEVAVRALTDPAPHDTDHILTGPEPLSYADVAAILGEFTGSPVRHRSLTEPDLAAHLTAAGLPADYARLLATMDTAIAHGSEDRTTSVVADVTGRPPRSFRDFCRARFPVHAPASGWGRGEVRGRR